MEPEVLEFPQHGLMGLRYSLVKGPVSVQVYQDPGVHGDDEPYLFWVNYHDGEGDQSWGCGTLEAAIDDGRRALDEAWERYVAEGGKA